MYSCLFSMSVASQKYTHNICSFQGRIQDFKLGGAHLKKLRRAEGGAKICWVFRVKNHDFTPKNHIFSNFRGGARRCAPRWIRHCYLGTVNFNNKYIQ